MKRLNPREMVILVITLVLAAFFLIFQFVIKPMHEGSVDTNDRLHQDLEQLAKARMLVAQKAKIEARYRHLVQLIGATDSDEAQMPAIVSKIEVAARQSNVHIANIQPQKASTRQEARFLAVELEIDGQWLDIVQFLYLLQQQPNFYFIDELNLEKYSGMVSSLRGRIVISRMSLINP